MTSEQLKHLDYIQGVISRMADNSFKIKGWMITLISALLALYVNNQNWLFLLVAFVPIFVFWFLDAYYLQQERTFRGLYDDVIRHRIGLFSMNIHSYEASKYSFLQAFLSKTICSLYGTIALLNVIALSVLLIKEFCCYCN